MENPIQQYRQQHRLTYEAIASTLGCARSAVFKQAAGLCKVSAEMAIKYNRSLGIPLSTLRPDLWPPSGTPAAAAEETCPENEAKSCPKSAEK